MDTNPDMTIQPDETLTASLHQQRSAAIDWSQSPPWATRYTARYNHHAGSTQAKWSMLGGADSLARHENAPVFFQMEPSERGMVIAFGESQGVREVVNV